MVDKPSVPTLEGFRENWTKLFDALHGESDFVCIVVATSYVDYGLGAIFEGHFIQGDTSATLLGHTGVLGSLNGKSSVAYCLDLISKGCKATIDRIAEIRNQFAHRLGELSFADSEIAALCLNLKLPAPNQNVKLSSDEPALQDVVASPRKRFIFIMVALCATLLSTAHGLPKCVQRNDMWK